MWEQGSFFPASMASRQMMHVCSQAASSSSVAAGKRSSIVFASCRYLIKNKHAREKIMSSGPPPAEPKIVKNQPKKVESKRNESEDVSPLFLLLAQIAVAHRCHLCRN